MIRNGELKDGMKVRTQDGHELGKIVRFDDRMVLIEKGFFFPKDYEVPISLVSEIRDGEACLSATRDELKRDEGQWSGAEGRRTATEGEGSREFGSMYTGTEASEGSSAGMRAGTGDRNEERLTLSEEELEARKTTHEAGQVRVRKEVHTETRQVDVPVMREEVHVERVPASASSASDPGADAFREKTISVPVREEEVEVVKKPRVREEVRVSKTPRVEERRLEAEVRSEDAKIERTDERERIARDDERDERGGGILGLGRDDER